MKPRICPNCSHEFTFKEVRVFGFQRELSKSGCPNCSTQLDLSSKGIVIRNIGLIALMLNIVTEGYFEFNRWYTLVPVLVFAFLWSYFVAPKYTYFIEQYSDNRFKYGTEASYMVLIYFLFSAFYLWK